MGRSAWEKAVQLIGRPDWLQCGMRLLAGWFVACSVAIGQVKVGFDVLAFVGNVSMPLFLLMIALTYGVLTAARRWLRRSLDAWALGVSALFYGLLIAARNRNSYFGMGVILALCLLGYFLLRDDKLGLGRLRLSKRAVIVVFAAAGAFFVLYVGGLTTLRYLNYSSSTYDFGIFAQMFHHMKETLLPNTTCERNGLLSHFAIHLSPIYYLLLPGYFLFPSPVYLQVTQSLVVASGLLPLFLLARHFSLSHKAAAVFGVVYALHPAVAGSCFYDIHENMFLTPLLLWAFYFAEKQRWPLVYLFGLLTCLVKEDAPVYVACLALFLFFSRKDRLHGTALFCVAVAYFGAAMVFLQSMGQGIMTGRYNNFISDADLGLLSVFKTLLLNPAYLINEVFTSEKLLYMACMLLPLAGLPLLCRKPSQLLLMIPFLLINLMSDYPYQHSLGFQYNFGALAFLFYLSMRNLPEFSGRFRRYALPFMGVASAVLFLTNVGGHSGYLSSYLANWEQNQKLDAYLEAIPEEATVQATGYLVPKLSGRMVLYDYTYNQRSSDPHETEYIVLDLRPGREQGMEEAAAECREDGYETVVYEEDLVAVFRAAQAE